MTEQIEYVSKRMELLDPQRLVVFQQRAKSLNEEFLGLMSDPQELKDLSHDREEVEVLYKASIKVKPVIASLEKTVDSLEQKKRTHDMSAKVILDIEQMEL